MARKKYIIGNWKLNKFSKEINKYFDVFNAQLSTSILKNKNIFIGISPIHLFLTQTYFLAKPQINVIAQDISWVDHGSYTGQISCQALKECKINHVIIGHSETRKYLGVDDKIVNAKLKQIIANNMSAIICIGESLEQYNKKQTKKVLTTQLKTIFKDIKFTNNNYPIIAYEPLWAIGSGKTPTTKEINDICLFIRNTIKKIYNTALASKTPILYGGSVDDKNASSIAALKEVDGLLIGGASLDPHKFLTIIQGVIKC